MYKAANTLHYCRNKMAEVIDLAEKYRVCPTVSFFCLSYRGQVCGQRGSSPLSVRLLRRQNFGSPLAKFMIFGFVGNDLANDLAVTPANFSLPRQKYSTTKK